MNTMNKTLFFNFIDKLAKISGQYALCESVKSGFNSLNEAYDTGDSGLTGQQELDDIMAKVSAVVEKYCTFKSYQSPDWVDDGYNSYKLSCTLPNKMSDTIRIYYKLDENDVPQFKSISSAFVDDTTKYTDVDLYIERLSTICSLMKDYKTHTTTQTPHLVKDDQWLLNHLCVSSFDNFENWLSSNQGRMTINEHYPNRSVDNAGRPLLTDDEWYELYKLRNCN